MVRCSKDKCRHGPKPLTTNKQKQHAVESTTEQARDRRALLIGRAQLRTGHTT